MSEYHIYRKDTEALVTKKALKARELAKDVIDSRSIDWINDDVLKTLGPLDKKTGEKKAVVLTKVYATADVVDEVRGKCPDTEIESVELPDPKWTVPVWY